MTRWLPRLAAACLLAAPTPARADYLSWSAALSNTSTGTADLYAGPVQLSRPPGGQLPTGQGLLTSTGSGGGAVALDPSYSFVQQGTDPRTGQPAQVVYRAVLAAGAGVPGNASAAGSAGGSPYYFARYVFDISLRDVFYVGPVLGIHEEYVYYYLPDAAPVTTAGGPTPGPSAPEPASLLLAALGLPFAATFRRRV